MKKIIAALTLLLAFSINANAQDKGSLTGSSTEKGKAQAAELSTYLGLDKTVTESFYRLFEQKFTILEDATMSTERKEELARVIEAKIRATLDGTQLDKLDKNPELLKKLTH